MLWNDDEELEAIITVMESDSDDNDSDVVAEVIIRNPPLGLLLPVVVLVVR